MKHFDAALLRVLLKKQLDEDLSVFRGGRKNFDLPGFLLKAVLVVLFVGLFVIFFSGFLNLYLNIRIDGVLDVKRRQTELLTLLYGVLFPALTFSGVSAVNKSVFGGEDVRICSALPIAADTLFVSKALHIYLRQLSISLLTVLPANLTFAAATAPRPAYYVMTVVICLLLPLAGIAAASLLSLPVHKARNFLRHKFVLSFVLVTLVTAGGFFLYSRILEAVKGMLLGDQLQHFFSEPVMNVIDKLTDSLYPARWLADLLLLQDVSAASLCLAGMLVLCMIAGGFIIRRLLVKALQQRVAGDQAYIMLKKPSCRRRSVVGALIAKEFSAVFRTPGYMFGYFSVAVVMPLMVYFCMSIGVSLVRSLIFVDCSLELAVFLTILFGVLTNTFCATNISREGKMFYSVKAMPVSARQFITAKLLFCLLVTGLSSLVSAAVLTAAGYLEIWQGAFVFGVGLLFGFAQICFATRKDFNRPRFSSEEDGEIRESTNTVSTILVVGLLLAAIIGGIILYFRMFRGLAGGGSGSLTWYLVGGVSIAAAVLSYLCLMHRLTRKYDAFSEGI